MTFSCQGCGAECPPKKRASGRNPKWCSEKCRKGQYAGSCVDCGAATNGYDGPGKASQRCLSCSEAKMAVDKRTAQEDRMRVAISLRSQGMRNRQIAERMDTTPQGVANLLLRAKRRGFEVPRDPYMANRREALAA